MGKSIAVPFLGPHDQAPADFFLRPRVLMILGGRGLPALNIIPQAGSRDGGRGPHSGFFHAVHTLSS